MCRDDDHASSWLKIVADPAVSPLRSRQPAIQIFQHLQVLLPEAISLVCFLASD
jgi:hypothetical protein